MNAIWRLFQVEFQQRIYADTERLQACKESHPDNPGSRASGDRQGVLHNPVSKSLFRAWVILPIPPHPPASLAITNQSMQI